MTPERIAAAVAMRDNGDSVAKIAHAPGVGDSSVFRALANHDADQAPGGRVEGSLPPPVTPLSGLMECFTESAGGISVVNTPWSMAHRPGLPAREDPSRGRPPTE
ncbi:hypothetical protein [Microbacterium sp. 18062]|uniref:hypothetical protein n=1 Tax=Microbacterium sp. 18062 TaxID=2681410 RepID=UPI00135798FC|nr:hypothetical protein [Microbacterium sp. 18062]